MLRLRLLGQAELTAPDRCPVRTLPIQPRALALLAYVAVCQGPGRPRRDTLLGLFWPELDAASARHALSQALSALRGELGPGVLNGKWRAAVSIEPRNLWCDVVAFRDACEAGRFEEAIELYGGPLLAGFFVSDAPEFERWVEEQRRESQQLALRAALALTASARAERRWSDGCRWAERALTIDPYAELAWRELIGCLDAAHDRAGAIRAFQRLTERLRDDLGVEPAAETSRLIEEIRCRGSGGGDGAPEARLPSGAGGSPSAGAGWLAAGAPTEGAEGDEQRPGPGSPQEGRGAARSRGWRRLMLPALFVLLAAYAAWSRLRQTAPAELAPDPTLIAVVPFFISGLDSSYSGLETGMVDLLAMKLQDGSGVRAVNSRAMLSAWDRTAGHGTVNLPLDSVLALGMRLGAGRLLMGSVVGIPRRLSLNAVLYSVPDGRERGRATVTGGADSLIQLTDRLAAKVLGLAALEEQARIETLASTSLDAVRAYLSGLRRYRAGEYLLALRDYERALALDSTFALAAMGVMASAAWVGDEHARGAGHRADQRAWANRRRLGPADSLRLLSFVGFRRPGVTLVSEQVALVEHAVTLMPQDPELRYQLGEQLLHEAPLAGVSNWRPRATAAMARAVQLDSSFPAPWLHLLHLAADSRDTAALRRLGRGFLVRFPDEHEAGAIRWLLQVMLHPGDPPLEPLPRLDDLTLSRIAILSQSFAVKLEDAERALVLLRGRAASAAERARVSRRELSLALARGRPDAARRAWLSLLEEEQDPWYRRARLRSAIYAGLYGDGSPSAAWQAYHTIAPETDRPLGPEFAVRSTQLPDICAAELWRLAQGDTAEAAGAISKLRTVRFPRDPAWHVREAEVCAAVLEVARVEARGRGVSTSALEQLDSVLAAQPLIKEFGPPPALYLGNYTSARLWAARGHPERALSSLQRRGHIVDAISVPTAFLAAECRYGLQAGQVATASGACQRLLALRARPEPGLRPATDSLRALYDAFLRRARRR